MLSATIILLTPSGSANSELIRSWLAWQSEFIEGFVATGAALILTAITLVAPHVINGARKRTSHTTDTKPRWYMWLLSFIILTALVLTTILLIVTTQSDTPVLRQTITRELIIAAISASVLWAGLRFAVVPVYKERRQADEQPSMSPHPEDEAPPPAADAAYAVSIDEVLDEQAHEVGRG
jgi:Ca2+/H+ antiporter